MGCHTPPGIFLTQGSNPQLLHILHWQKDWRLKEKGAAEHELAGWLHWLNAHESEQTLGEREGQENLVGCHPWGHKESDTTQHLNNNNRGSSGTKLWWHKIVMAQNVTELYTLERLILCYINLPQLKKKWQIGQLVLSPQVSWTSLKVCKTIHENFQVYRTLHHIKFEAQTTFYKCLTRNLRWVQWCLNLKELKITCLS